MHNKTNKCRERLFATKNAAQQVGKTALLCGLAAAAQQRSGEIAQHTRHLGVLGEAAHGVHEHIGKSVLLHVALCAGFGQYTQD